MARLAELWGDGLQRFGGPFLAGAHFSAVDAFYAPVVFRLNTYQLSLDADGDAYAAMLLTLPGMQKWYEEGCAEIWREPSHEEEIHALGTWLEDRRAT